MRSAAKRCARPRAVATGRRASWAKATGLLPDVDARWIREFPIPAAAILFDRGGKRMLMGGTGKGLVLWDPATDRTERQDQDLNGPFALRAGGTSVQLGTTRPGPDQR